VERGIGVCVLKGFSGVACEIVKIKGSARRESCLNIRMKNELMRLRLIWGDDVKEGGKHVED